MNGAVRYANYELGALSGRVLKEQYVKSLKRYRIRSSTGITGITSLTSMELVGFILTEDLAHSLEKT